MLHEVIGERGGIAVHKDWIEMDMQQKKTECELVLNVAEIIYYLYFAIMIFAKGIGLYEGMWPYTAALILGFFLVALKLALTEHTLAEWLYVLGLSGIGVLVWHNSGEKGAIIYITMIVAMKNVSIKRLFSIGMVIWGITFVAQAILTITGLKPDIFVIHAKLGLGYIIRWSLGYPHPNVLQISFLILCAFTLYLADWKGKKLVYATLAMLIGNLYVFFYSISYTGLILVIVYLFGNLYLSFKKELTKLEKVLITLVFPACAAFAVLGPVVFQGRLWDICNKALNTRFHIAKTYLTTDTITLFGARPSPAIPVGLQNIDSSYVFSLMHYGAVLSVLLCAGYMALIHHCIREKKYKELAITIGLSIAAISEPFFVNTSFKNISLLFLGEYIFENFDKFANKRPDHFLNRKFLLCPLGQKEIEIPVGWLLREKNYYAQVLADRKKIILAGTAGVAMIAGIVFGLTADMPECYYALRSSTQIEEESVYLDLDNLPEDFNGKILNYKDAQTRMQRVEGNIVTVEYVRGIVSSGLWCGTFGAVVISFIICIKKKRK